ncbi:dual specificity protein phosphatase 8 [Denticeps clupeoides]|nr:dual specificity protein phosphatase 8-like [Denticeps clupeoides]
MVLYREKDPERPPLSRILPHLYLGAEADVTQDGLSARGISYVLSVSRGSPQPAFLPASHFLRVPIDDSLRDDLLPWIPEALRFIDGAISLGCSVLVHCAAGISRSPALAVAYIMHRLGLDLDHAYRFVKERRPTISPNFNFLGQLQLFQSTLTQKCVNANQSGIKCTEVDAKQSATVALPSKHIVLQEDKNRVPKSQDGASRPSQEFTLCLSDRLKNLSLSLEPHEAPRAAARPRQGQQEPADRTSLSEKRKRLTLALTPQHSPEEDTPGSRTEENQTCTSPRGLKGALGAPGPSARAGEDVRGPCGSQQAERRKRPGRRRDGDQRRDARPQAGRKASRPKPEDPGQKRRRPPGCQQEAPRGAVEAVEGTGGDQALLSPLGVTVNKLLDWGEKMLLGVLLGPRVRVGQAALPYRC